MGGQQAKPIQPLGQGCGQPVDGTQIAGVEMVEFRHMIKARDRVDADHLGPGLGRGLGHRQPKPTRRSKDRHAFAGQKGGHCLHQNTGG